MRIAAYKMKLFFIYFPIPILKNTYIFSYLEIPRCLLKGLVLEDIVKTYGAFSLKVDYLEIDHGSAVCIKGPNGSGKTTLLNIVAGVVIPDKGRILYDGIDITNLEPERRRFPLIRGDRSIFPHMSVLKNIVFAKRVNDEELDRIMDLLRIARDLYGRKASSLSTGWRIRISIARALASDPRVLLIDEALDHLDPDYYECCIKDLLGYIKEKRIIALIVSHRDDIPCEEIIVVRDGRIYLPSSQ